MSQASETFIAERERELNGLPIIRSGMSKTDLSIAAKTAVDNLMERGNVLEIAEQVSCMEHFLKEVKADPRYTRYVREEVEKYGKEFKTSSGAKIELAEVGTKYDFSQCGDVVLQRWENSLSELEEKIKARKDLLKSVPSEGLTQVDMETGETFTVYPPSKSSTSSVKITLSK